jgi:hypothetical protein
MKSIYVQIPAYRDTELAPTLFDLLAKAESPDRLRVAIFWQRSDSDRLPDELRRHESLEFIERDYRESQGCNWARAELSGDGEARPTPCSSTPIIASSLHGTGTSSRCTRG